MEQPPLANVGADQADDDGRVLSAPFVDAHREGRPSVRAPFL
jgi:hypothetical protein